MNYIDYILLLPLIWGLYRGFTKGLIIELASLLALIAGVYGALHFSSYTLTYIQSYIDLEPAYMQILSYGLTFILIVVLITFIGRVLTLLVKMVALGFVNRLIGALFGALKSLLIISVLLLFFDRINSQYTIVKEELLTSSILYQPILTQVKSIYPDIIKEIEEQKEQFELY